MGIMKGAVGELIKRFSICIGVVKGLLESSLTMLLHGSQNA